MQEGDKMKLMIVGAHPADPVDLSGGTIAQHANNGNIINVVTVTDGIFSHTTGEETIQTKRKEVLNAISNLTDSHDHFFMGLRDEPLIVGSDAILELVNLIRQIKPDVLVTHHPNEYAHWDHAETGKMVCRALKGAVKLPGDRYFVPNVYFFAVQFRPEMVRLGFNPLPPAVLVDITNVVGKKVAAMCCFKSQGHDNYEAIWKRMNSMESEMGRADGLAYSEGFISYYPLKEKLLPMSSIDKSFYVKESPDGK
jgi:LmbE family N-acetylglucosaminyl deacetylase